MRADRLLRRAAIGGAALSASVLLAACADTLQRPPLRDRDLTSAEAVNYSVYWVGRGFEGMPLSFAAPFTGGSVVITYGNCIIGGQSTCVRPLTIVTSHDNSFVPGSRFTPVRRQIRGRTAVVAMGGTTIEIATGDVVVDIYASSAALARAAAESLEPLNRPGSPSDPLAPPGPPSGYAQSAS